MKTATYVTVDEIYEHIFVQKRPLSELKGHPIDSPSLESDLRPGIRRNGFFFGDDSDAAHDSSNIKPSKESLDVLCAEYSVNPKVDNITLADVDEIYTGEPNTNKSNATEATEIVDPLVHLRNVAQQVGVKLDWDIFFTNSKNEYKLEDWGDGTWEFTSAHAKKEHDALDDLCCTDTFYVYLFYMNGEGKKELPKDFLAYIDGKKEEQLGKRFGEFHEKFNSNTATLQDFGKFLPKIKVLIGYDRFFDKTTFLSPDMVKKLQAVGIITVPSDWDGKKPLEYEGYENIYCASITLGQTSDTGGRFVVQDAHYTDSFRDDQNPKMRARNRKLFRDISSVPELSTDYRPYIHRMMELYAHVPQEQWHDPMIYNSNEQMQAKAQAMNALNIIDEAVGMLFSGDERAGLEKSMKNARLQAKKDWASVPRLNLGAIRLPGLSNGKYDFLVQSTPLVIEYLHRWTSMAREDAEELIARRLAHCLMHDTDAQVSYDRAIEIRNMLESQIGNQIYGQNRQQIKTAVAR